MAIQSIGNTPYGTTGSVSQNNKPGEGKAAEEAKESTPVREDTFVKSAPDAKVTYTPDLEKISAMKAQLSNNMNAFRNMVQDLFGQQVEFTHSSLQSLLEKTGVKQGEEAQKAAEAFLDDPTWGVDAVSTRILDFAKAISGGDPEKIELLRKAVQDGFKATEKAWGSALPEVSGKTYDKIMQGFDDWAAEAKAIETE
ncbi:hypothetical protein LJC49_03800 [Ruminococcaceae bacterium OttesenSCG-928-I18]|nr:hypothetical protein [Ruminococcaceae bacterium OttesenSCG-928-I18]